MYQNNLKTNTITFCIITTILKSYELLIKLKNYDF